VGCSRRARQQPHEDRSPVGGPIIAQTKSRLTISSHVHRLWGKSYPLYFSATTAPSSDANSVVSLRGRICCRRGEQGSAEAIANRVDTTLSGRRLDCVQCRQRSLEHVIFKALCSELLIGIYPGDGEDSMSLIDGPFDEGVLRL